MIDFDGDKKFSVVDVVSLIMLFIFTLATVVCLGRLGYLVLMVKPPAQLKSEFFIMTSILSLLLTALFAASLLEHVKKDNKRKEAKEEEEKSADERTGLLVNRTSSWTPNKSRSWTHFFFDFNGDHNITFVDVTTTFVVLVYLVVLTFAMVVTLRGMLIGDLNQLVSGLTKLMVVFVTNAYLHDLKSDKPLSLMEFLDFNNDDRMTFIDLSSFYITLCYLACVVLAYAQLIVSHNLDDIIVFLSQIVLVVMTFLLGMFFSKQPPADARRSMHVFAVIGLAYVVLLVRVMVLIGLQGMPYFPCAKLANGMALAISQFLIGGLLQSSAKK